MQRPNTLNGKFIPGDPVTRQPGSILTAQFMNSLLEELINICVKAGIELDESDNEQIYQAILEIIKSNTLNKEEINLIFDGLLKQLNSTENEKGDYLISVVAPFLGAVKRSQHEKNSDIVSILDFHTKKPGESLVKALSTGRRVLIPANISEIRIAFEQVEIVLKNLYLIDAEADLDIVLPSGVIHFMGNDIARIGQNHNIRLIGAPPVHSVINSVESVTGGTGNWYVKLNLSSAAGMAVGDILRVHDVLPGRPHYNAVFTGLRNAMQGEIGMGFHFFGSITTSDIDTTCSVNSLDQNVLQVGDLVHVKGETRQIISIRNNTFTVDEPWSLSSNNQQWWFFTKPNIGTVSLSGSTVNGVGTKFLDDASVGDVLLVDGVMLKIKSINSNTSMTVSHNVPIKTSSKYTIIVAGLVHEGSFEIMAVNENTVTLLNKSRYAPPPSRGIFGGTATAIKTVLRSQNESGNGFVFDRGSILKEIRDIAIQGVGADAVGTGLALNGISSDFYNQHDGFVTMKGACAVIGWGRGAFLAAGAKLVAMGQHFCGNENTGIECTDGADAYLREAVVSHNNGLGIFQAGGYVRLSSSRLIGNKLQGVRQDVGGSIYGDSWWVWGNGSHGVMMVNGSSIQFVDSICIANGGNGINGQNGPSGRLSRTVFGANENHNILLTNVKMEATQTWATGTPVSQSGVVVSKSEVDFDNSAQTGNGSQGFLAISNAIVSLENAFQTKNGGAGIRSDSNANISAVFGLSKGNVVNNYQINNGVLLQPKNIFGSHSLGSHYAGRFLIDKESVAIIYVGNTNGLINLWSSRNDLYGNVRFRAGSSNNTSLGWGVGINTSREILTGQTGLNGMFTVSAGNDGYIYLENRTSTVLLIEYDICGLIT